MARSRRIQPSAGLLLVMSVAANAAGVIEGFVDYGLESTESITLTSAAGDKLARQPNRPFVNGVREAGARIVVDPAKLRQTLLGIGTSFTESSAYVLAHLEPGARAQVMSRIFAVEGANFALARTPIGATDFSVEGRYSYADTPGDTDLVDFSIAPDRDGFDRVKHPRIADDSFDLLPMIQQALAIKSSQQDSTLRIMASAWTAPAWMKDIEDWYRPGTEENGYQGGGGSLKPQYEAAYADYLIRYLDAYHEQGVSIWALTPVNEPLGNNGQWESMHFSAPSQRDFIKHHLGPKLHASRHADTRLYILDHSRDHLPTWADTIYGDPDAARYVTGAAVHWYESTFKVYEDLFEQVHDRYPEFSIVHSEGCIDDLGKDAPAGVLDPVGYKESGWFDNDDFWWGPHASDWAYSVTWQGVDARDHPLYTPAHRYARNIIVSLNHWLEGWIDWNIVLDARGGPNHVGNYCGAPIMIDTETGYVYYTPIYYLLAQFSRSIRPGDRAVYTESSVPGGNLDALHASASINARGLLSVQILNTTDEPIEYDLQVGAQHVQASIAANALQTVQVSLPDAD